MPGIEFPAPLALVLAVDLAGPAQGKGEDLAPLGIPFGLAPDVPDQTPQAGAQELYLALVAFELLGVGVAPGHHRRVLGHPNVGLAQLYPVLPGQRAQLVDRREQELGPTSTPRICKQLI